MDCELTEAKILQMSACQGVFKIRLRESVESNKVRIVMKLVGAGHLEHSDMTDKNTSYSITEKGKEYLKTLHVNVKQSKHSLTPELVAVGFELQEALSKRLNLLKSANNRGLEFNLTDANVKSLLKKKSCHYTGVEFDLDDDPLNVRTFERINDDKGYVHGNVVVVTLRANRIKNMLLEGDHELKISVKQFIKMAEKINEHLGD